MNLNLSPKLFGPLFWTLKEATDRLVIHYGGAGSGKSFTQSQLELFHHLTHTKKTLVTRKVAATLKDSVEPLIIEQLKTWKIWDFYEHNKSDHTFTNTYNGHQIFCRGLDDPEKIKSIQGIGRIWAEEATEYTRDDIDQLNLRMRGDGGPFQLTMTLNPISESHWIKKEHFDKNSAAKILHSTYLDNPWIDPEYVALLESWKTTNPYRYMVYAKGIWGKLEVENPFAYNFDYTKHASEVARFDPSERIHFAMDFNRMPLTCIAFHFDPGHFFHVFDEFTLEHGSIPQLVDAIAERYGEHLWNATITGDALGKHGDLSQRDYASHYELLRRGLGMTSKQIQVPGNPKHKTSRLQTNFMLASHPFVLINPKKCPNLVADLQTVEVKPDESIIKKDRKKQEQRADHLDCFRYAINTHFYKWISRNMSRRAKTT